MPLHEVDVTRAVLWSALAALALYVGHAALLGTWIVDDAGISFAYARNLATGHGLVSQPGAVPVEGFTNLAWVLLLSLTMWLHLFDPMLTPKVLGAVCVVLAFLGTGALFADRGRRPGWLVAVALAVPAVSSGFAIWCASGLENALYVVLVVTLGVITLAPVRTPKACDRRAAAAGGTLFLLFCTRPDAAFYFWIPAFLFGLGARDGRWQRALRIYIAAFLLPWFLLTIFRGVYFHDVFPNTFYAKQAEGAKIFAWMLRHMSLPWFVAVVMAVGTLVIGACGWGFHALGQRLGSRLGPEFGRRYGLVLLFITAYGIVLALPGDWMLEHRFATPMFLFGPAAGMALLWELLARVGPRTRTVLVGIAAAAGLGAAGVYSARHTPAFVRAPTLGFDAVSAMSRRIAAAMEPLGPQATVLTPDIGGALWENRFRVLDLVGLTDRELGRDVRRDRDGIRRHVLEVRRPEGVWVHTFWMGVTGFDVDPAFRLAYAPVWEERPSPSAPPLAGFYLRRDVATIESDGSARPRAPEALESWR